PECFARAFTICQIRVVVSFVPRLERKISLLVRRFTSFGRSVDTYAASASHALVPTGTSRILFPLPVTRRIRSSALKFSIRAFAREEPEENLQRHHDQFD